MNLRIGAVSYVAGPILCVVTGLLQPQRTPRGDAPLVFAAYPASAASINVHFAQFFAAVLLMNAFLCLYQYLKSDREPAAALAFLGAGAVVATIAVVALQQAIDGTGLTYLAARWAAAGAADRDTAYRVTEAVSWIDIGINSYSRILLGVVLVSFGAAIALGRLLPRWLGLAALAIGAGWVWTGVVVGHEGFSAHSIGVGVVPTFACMAWFVCTGMVLWRCSVRLPGVELLQRAAARMPPRM